MGVQSVAVAFAAAAASAADLKVISYGETAGGFHVPARGWNSFGLQSNNVGADFTFDQAHVMAQCDVMASSQLAPANYTYCSLDSGWSVGGNGDEHGRILYDAAKFDIPRLADHLHAQGLQLGLYVVPGAFQADLNKTILGTDTKIGDVCDGDEGMGRCVFNYTRPEVQAWHDSVVKQFADW